MKAKYLIWGIFSFILLVAIITNPNQDRHKEVIKNKINVYLQKSMKETLTETDDEFGKAGQTLGIALGAALVDKIIDNLISTNNYVLLSTTKMTWNGESKIIGLGAFGNVYVTKKFDEALNEGLLNSE